jgi:hypothetical protein
LPVVWTATASGNGTTPVFQFSLGPDGGESHVIRDFSTSNTFTWDPTQEGSYVIQVTVKDSFSASTGESASASYTSQSRVVGTSAVISSMSNPLVALYSAPPSSGLSMYVQFAKQDSTLSWRSTTALPIVAGKSTNFIVAGMLPNTTYLMRHVLDDGTTSNPISFTTGPLPTNVKFPTFTVPQSPAPGTDLTEELILHSGIRTPADTVNPLATDLNGNIVWYYDSVDNNFPNYATNIVPGGTVFLLGGAAGSLGGFDAVREINLAGDSLRETGVGAVNAELATMGQRPISQFDHEIKLLPNGDIAVLASNSSTINVNGIPTRYVGNEVIVLDQNFQVTWVWDGFNWLDTNRLGTDGEGPDDWLHANSISWSPGDGDLLVSLRAQDWVIKIDYANGTGNGHIVWRLGQGGDFTINSSDPYPWFTHQHDARQINDTTLVLFDNGNTRHDTTPYKDSRGQELILNEQTMQATLVVNADLGNYSSAVGSAQLLPNGNLDFTSGLQGSGPNIFGQSIEVLPNGMITYVQQMSSFEYRSYFMNTLYGPLVNLVNLDTSTQGSWIGTYGATGYSIVSGPSSLPSGDTITPAKQSTYTWTTTTTDPRALEIPGSSNRVAAVWYSPTSFTVDVNLGDGKAHGIELYFDDWANKGRAETVQISDAASGDVLSTQSISSFQSGVYLDYALSGHIVITITRTAGPNAVLNGLFLDPTSTAPVSEDTSTQGSWIGTYGATGYSIVSGPTSLPSGDTITPAKQSTYTWTTTTTDPRALQIPGSSNRIAAVWYSSTKFTIDVNLADGQTHNLELYFLDWDNRGRGEKVQISDAGTGTVLDTETISSFTSGVYLDWKVSGHLLITITRQAGANAVVNGLFLDSNAPPPPPPAATASFLKQDLTTTGSWVGTYGGQGYDIVSGPSSLPSNDSVVPSGQLTYTSTTTSTDPRALQVPGSSNRVAAVWYSSTKFTIDVNLADGQTHNLELYFLDWGNKGRGEQVQVSDAGTGAVLDTETISSFTSGVYLDWKVSGHLLITITRQAGANGIVNGLFLDAPS